MLENCPICDSKELKKDDKIHNNSVIVICQTCGFATHDYDYSKEHEILEYYKNEHRKNVVGKQKPDYQNIVTTNNKKSFIAKFLNDFLKDKKGLIVGDVGAATGYLVQWFRSLGHKATGCEYAVQYRRMSEHYYGIPLTEELDTKYKYDLITIYHVLEHMMRPDVKLKKYRDMLKEDGHILISVPEYFNRLDEGVGTNVLLPGTTAQTEFDVYFSKDHINIFSRQSIKNLINVSGFEIVKEDYEAYGITFLCKKKSAPDTCNPINKENWEEIYTKMLAVKTAFEYAGKEDFKKAIEIYPEFPEAHIAMLMKVYQKDPVHQEDYIREVENIAPQTANGARFLATKGMWLYQNQRYQEALEIFERYVNLRPNPDIFMFMSWCLLELGRHKEAISILNYSIMLCPMKWQEAVNFQIHAACNMLTWDERAIEEMKESFAAQNKDAIKAMAPKDPIMNG